MTPLALLQALNNANFVFAIQQGAAWELIAENMIVQEIFNATGVRATRQYNYPGGGNSTCDFAFAEGTLMNVVELKVESAVNAGQFSGVSFVAARANDYAKLLGFNVGALNAPLMGVMRTGPLSVAITMRQHVPFVVNKMQVFVAYSGGGRASVGGMAVSQNYPGPVTVGVDVVP